MTGPAELHEVVVGARPAVGDVLDVMQPEVAELDRQIAAAVARKTGRGWRIEKAERGSQVDAAIAFAMACERVQHRREPVRLLGWI